MIVLTGRVLLGLAVAAGVIATLAWWSAETNERVERARRLAPLVAAGATAAAFVLLEVALFTDDFTVRFVATHHRSTTGALFTFTSAWAGLEGSLLLWTLMIVGYLVIVARQARHSTDRVAATATAVIATIGSVFLVIVLIVAPVFSRSPRKLAEGFGANPLLQDNLLMAIHPPLLYLGYVGMLVPFAFAMSAMWHRDSSPGWVRHTHRWALIAWGFLTAGIVIGGWWSYDVLGWGGYWAWDPVENASFLPWLAATAYLHAAVVQSRRGMLQAWSVGLAVSTFLFTLLGTFLARSGVIASVHAFSGSSLGPVLLVVLIVVAVIAGWLFATRMGSVIGGPKLDGLASRDGMFVVNNLLLATFIAVVSIGTLYPIVIEAVRGDRITVGRPFFDVFAVWITLALMVAMIAGVVAPHRSSSLGVLWQRLRLAVTVGLATASCLIVFAGLRAPYVIVVVALAATVIAVSVAAMISDTRARRDRRGIGAAAVGALRARPGFWGGQVAHVGLAIAVVGIAASSNLAQRSTLTLRIGESAAASGFEVTYQRPTAADTATYTSRGVKLTLSRGGLVRTLNPQLRTYPNQREPLAKPDVWTRWTGDDAYVAILALDTDSVTVHVYRYPWMWLVWLGGLTMAGGAATGLLLRRLRHRANEVAAQRLGAAADEQLISDDEPELVEQ